MEKEEGKEKKEIEEGGKREERKASCMCVCISVCVDVCVTSAYTCNDYS